MKKKTIIWATFSIAIVAISLQACKKDEPAEGIDLDLLNMANETSGFVWFRNSDAWLPASSGTGHNYSNLRTRFNSTAATQLDASGEVVPNAQFPDGSLIAKELSDGGSVERYAILYKMADSEFSDSNGWVWGYVNADGTVATSAEDKGSGCTGCHSQTGNIDQTLMNKYFGIDNQLLEMARQTTGFVWYKNSDAWLAKSSGSGHNYTSLRTRYNSTAATQLDGNGMVAANATFPEGSLVVKELSNGTSAQRYAILYKQTNSEHADDNGWVWGYMNQDGNIAASAKEKGAICTSCHLQSDNIDYMLMNKFFP